MRSAFSLLFAGLAGLIALDGCAHYQLGSGTKPGFATLYIAPVQNRSDLPQAAAIVSAQLREAFLRDGRVGLVGSPAEADATLAVTLVSYSRETLTTQPGDAGLARKFGLTLNATATLHSQRSGQTLFAARPLQAERQIFTDSGQLLAETNAVPLLAETLATAALHATLDTW